MSKALDGVVVIDLTREFFGSVAGALLADFGATVVRVEDLSQTDTPDPNRDGMHPAERWDAHSELAHRNKQSLAVDLSSDAGKQILNKLIAKSDVLLSDLPFKELEARGWDHDSLCKLRPEIILTRGSGFGPKGPDADLPAIDELAASRAGLMSQLGEPGQPPVFTGTGQMHTAVMLALGTLLALYHRDESGKGQIVDASLLGGNMYAASLDLQAYLAIKEDRLMVPISRLDLGNPMSGPSYPCSDGSWASLAMPDTGRYWESFSELVGLDSDDPRFNTHEKRTEDNRRVMMQVLDGLFAKQPGAHWKKGFDDRKLPADIIEKYDYPAQDPQALINRYILNLNHPSHGEIQSLGFPIYMSETPARLRSMAPSRGQHSAEILQDLLDYTDETIEALEAQGTIA